MMLNSNKIKGRLVELGLTQKDVADALNLAQATVSQKINGVRPLYLEEAKMLADLLKISAEEFGLYFFDAILRKAKMADTGQDSA